MTPSHVVSLAFVAAMMAATPVAAQGPDAQTASPLEDFLHALRLSTTVRLDYFQSSKELDDRENLFGATLQLKALPRFNDRLEGKLELRHQEVLPREEVVRVGADQRILRVDRNAGRLRRGRNGVPSTLGDATRRSGRLLIRFRC